MKPRGPRLGKPLDRYTALGLGLATFGVPFAAFSYLILLNIPLTALGIACAILGATVALIPESPVPTQTIRAMVEGSCASVESLLEARAPEPYRGRLRLYSQLAPLLQAGRL